jgi:flagellar basal-body rod protein FlgB
LDLSSIGLFALAEKRLSWLDRRQALLADNVANADTPGWQPRDLAPFAKTLAKTAGIGLATTRPGHLAGTFSSTLADDADAARPASRAPDGNAVSIEDQLMKVADTETSQEMVTNLYTKYLGLFRLALGR